MKFTTQQEVVWEVAEHVAEKLLDLDRLEMEHGKEHAENGIDSSPFLSFTK